MTVKTAGIPLLLALVLLAVAGCAGRVSRTVDDEGGQQSSVTLFGNRHEAALDKAIEQKHDGRFAAAEQTLLGVYRDPSAEDKYREQALLELSQVQSSLLNPDRDLARAIETLRKLEAEFPASENLDRVRQRIAELQANLDRQ